MAQVDAWYRTVSGSERVNGRSRLPARYRSRFCTCAANQPLTRKNQRLTSFPWEMESQTRARVTVGQAWSPASSQPR